MSRNLSTERPFLIITDFEEHPILQSYRIMNATFILPTEDIDFNQYGTVICVSTSDGYFSAVATQCSSRFFGIIIKYGYLQVMPKSTYCPSAKLESAYIGIPTSHSKENCPDGFWDQIITFIIMLE
jgi:hypothetical protein